MKRALESIVLALALVACNAPISATGTWLGTMWVDGDPTPGSVRFDLHEAPNGRLSGTVTVVDVAGRTFSAVILNSGSRSHNYLAINAYPGDDTFLWTGNLTPTTYSGTWELFGDADNPSITGTFTTTRQ